MVNIRLLITGFFLVCIVMGLIFMVAVLFNVIYKRKNSKKYSDEESERKD